MATGPRRTLPRAETSKEALPAKSVVGSWVSGLACPAAMLLGDRTERVALVRMSPPAESEARPRST